MTTIIDYAKLQIITFIGATFWKKVLSLLPDKANKISIHFKM